MLACPRCPPSQLGAMYSVCVLAMALVVKPATMLSDRLGNRRTLLLPGLYGSALALALQPLCLTVTPYVAVPPPSLR